MPRNVMISALVTEELAKKLEALAAALSSMIAILLAKAVDNPTASEPTAQSIGLRKDRGSAKR